MDNNWISDELNFIDLGDQRLNKRLTKLTENFLKSPESSINQACENWADSKSAYRFFQNEKISYKEIIKSHIKNTKERCNEYADFLTVQDTTYFTYSHPKTKGLCALSKNRGKHKEAIYTLGLIMHSTLAVSTDGLPLGIIDQKIYSRPELSDEVLEIKKKSHNNALPIEEKESYRWVESLKNTNAIFDSHSSNPITICDRESDMYDFFLVANELENQVLVRANHNRKVNKKSIYSEMIGIELWNLLKGKKPIGNIEIKVPKQKNRGARIAKCEIKTSQFELNPPRNYIDKNRKKLPILNMYAIYVSEINTTNETEYIDWMLLTNIPITTIEEALEKISWYCLRWRIEVFHKILKSGLKVEDCRLSTSERLIRYLSVMSIVAWRIFWLTIISRIAPNITCSLFLNEMEWKILFLKYNKNKMLPEKSPSMKQCIIWIAQLGGFLSRKNDGEPGITHVWRGLKKFSNILEGAEIMRDTYG
jgi:hypothetical protein